MMLKDDIECKLIHNDEKKISCCYICYENIIEDEQINKCIYCSRCNSKICAILLRDINFI